MAGAGPLALGQSRCPCWNSTLTAAGTTAQQQITTAQGYIAAGQIGAGASATPYPPILTFFGGMFGYYEAVGTRAGLTI